MGLDIRIRRIRKKYVNELDTPKEVYENEHAQHISYFNNLWKWILLFKLTKKESKEALAYRFLTKDYKCNVEEKEVNEMINNFIDSLDTDTFVYVLQLDY